MLISNTFFTIVAIALPFIIMIGGGILTYKKLGKWGVIISILLGAFAWAGSQMAATHIYIVQDCSHLLDYRLIGSVEYDLHNGEKINVPYSPRKVIVLNNSESALVLEEVIYGGYLPGFSADPQINWIEPLTYEVFELPKTQIDYFFDETIPEEIEEYGSGNKSRYWLYCE